MNDPLDPLQSHFAARLANEGRVPLEALLIDLEATIRRCEEAESQLLDDLDALIERYVGGLKAQHLKQNLRMNVLGARWSVAMTSSGPQPLVNVRPAPEWAAQFAAEMDAYDRDRWRAYMGVLHDWYGRRTYAEELREIVSRVLDVQAPRQHDGQLAVMLLDSTRRLRHIEDEVFPQAQEEAPASIWKRAHELLLEQWTELAGLPAEAFPYPTPEHMKGAVTSWRSRKARARK